MKKGSICDASLCSISSSCFSVNPTPALSALPTHPPWREVPLRRLCSVTDRGGPKAAIAGHTLPHRGSPPIPSTGSPRRLPGSGHGAGSQGTPSTALAQSCSSSPGSTWQRHVAAPAGASSQAPSSGGTAAEARSPLPITGFTQWVPRAKPHVPAFFGQRPTSRHEVRAGTPVPAAEMEGAPVKPRPGWSQRPARSWGCSAGARTARAAGRDEESGSSGPGAGRGRASPPGDFQVTAWAAQGEEEQQCVKARAGSRAPEDGQVPAPSPGLPATILEGLS